MSHDSRLHLRQSGAKPVRGVCQFPLNAYFAFGRLAGKDAFKLLIEVWIETGTRFDAGHFACRIEFVAIHPVDTETFQTALLIKETNTVSVMERLHPGYGKVIAALLSFIVPISSPRDFGVSKEDISRSRPCKK